MAELKHERDATAQGAAQRETERRLRARIGELEALLEARTQTIIGMGARLSELQGRAPASTVARLQAAEQHLAALEGTKLFRWAAVPRRVYARVAGSARG